MNKFETENASGYICNIFYFIQTQDFNVDNASPDIFRFCSALNFKQKIRGRYEIMLGFHFHILSNVPRNNVNSNCMAETL